MSNRSRWGLVTVILAIIALVISVVGPWNGLTHRDEMGATLQSAMQSNGYNDVVVTMSGNVAALSGGVTTQDRKASALELAKNTVCEKCSGKKARSWHEVRDDGLAVKTVNASPYTFSAIKSEDGTVVFDGYVQNDAEKSDVLAHAASVYGETGFTDKVIRIVAGAPNASWGEAVKQQMSSLSQLDSGQASLENLNASLSGKIGSAGAKAALLGALAMPQDFAFAETLQVPAVVAPVVSTQEGCQSLFDKAKGSDRINFRFGSADVDSSSFTLLDKISKAAKQCPDFVVSVEGHTDSDGSDSYNQTLSDQRAATVAAYLQVEQNVPAANLTSQGFGETKPIAPNTTSEGKAKNRRIDFIVTRSE